MSELVNGMIIKAPHQNAPSFVKAGISIKVEEFITYLKTHDNNGWVNMDLKESREGKLYVSLNDWKPKDQAVKKTEQVFSDDIPF